MTTSTDTNLLANILLKEVATGGFGNTVEEYLDNVFRNHREDRTFYSRILKEEGKEAAEAKLAEWAEDNHDHRVADALAPIVVSLSRLLEVEHRNISVKQFDKTDRSIFPFPYQASRFSYGIAVTNPEVPGCGCTQAKGAEVFSLWGELGITSFVVVIDPLQPENNSLVLMLPIRDDKKGNENRHGFVAVVMSRDGSIRSEVKEVYLYKNAAEHLAFGGVQPFGVSTASGGSPCGYVGFPGAQEFITSSLDNLAEYLSDVANKLSGQHDEH
ncbi:MAG: hypothetical protein WBP12_02185 [Candidatus Saccharimonas sp.]